MVFHPGTEKLSNKIINILSDNRVSKEEWRYGAPIFIVHKPLPVVINARCLAEGILDFIDEYDLDVPPTVVPKRNWGGK